MSNTGNSIKFEAIREIAFGSITGSYANFGSVFTRDVFQLVFINNTDADLYFSVDGVTNNIKMPAFSSRIYDFKTNDEYLRHGTQWEIKYASAPTKGWAGMEVIYV